MKSSFLEASSDDTNWNIRWNVKLLGTYKISNFIWLILIADVVGALLGPSYELRNPYSNPMM